MPGAISDSSTLIHLASIGRLNLLLEFFGDVTVPPAVWREVVEEGLGRRGSQDVAEAARLGWLRIICPSNVELIRLLRQTLDDGEAEAIALALEHPGHVLLLDESDGRRIANVYGLILTGAVGLLMRAKAEDKISSFRNDLHRLRYEAGFWISDELYRRAIEETGESLE